MARIIMPVEATRLALKELRSFTAENGSGRTSWDRMLTVREHEGALDPSRPIVIGDRGTGKSFWSNALSNESDREKLAGVYSRLNLSNVNVRFGYGEDEFNASHPIKSELHDLATSGFGPEAIWRAVILFLMPDGIRPPVLDNMSWTERVSWVTNDPALRRADFVSADKALGSQNRRFLVVFDALDTLASDWGTISKLVRGLLQIGLFLRSARSLKIKLFMRPDMADDPTLWAVGDSSKLRYDEVTLAWTRRDLHALLTQYLANHEYTRGDVEAYCTAKLKDGLKLVQGRYEVPAQLLANEDEQQDFFALIAGKFMGANATKGRTYTWVPNHLANARGHAAPRSFLLALGVAAEQSKSPNFALDVQGIQEGVRQASKIRMNELREDYRWIDAIFRPMKDMLVPVDKSEFVKRWREQKVVGSVFREMEADDTGRYLPPPRVTTNSDDTSTYSALVETLDHLSIIETTTDGRINMPDLFRLAAGVKRMGGVKLRP